MSVSEPERLSSGSFASLLMTSALAHVLGWRIATPPLTDVCPLQEWWGEHSGCLLMTFSVFDRLL
jgi:hypothetical protein